MSCLWRCPVGWWRVRLESAPQLLRGQHSHNASALLLSSKPHTTPTVCLKQSHLGHLCSRLCALAWLLKIRAAKTAMVAYRLCTRHDRQHTLR